MAGLLRSGAVVGAMTMVSRVLGLVRDMMTSALLGATGSADAYVIAFRIPNLLRRLFAEGAFSQAFVPVLSEYATTKDHNEVKRLLNSASGALALILAAITVVAVVASPLLVWVFAPGFAEVPGKMELTAQMLRIMFPYLLLISLTAFCGAVLNTWDRFAVPALTPVFLNLTMIASMLWLSPHLSIPAMALAWGVLAAGVIQLGFQLPFLWRLRLLPKPWPDFRHPGVKRILKLMGPAIFGVSVSQINLTLNSILASFLTTGSATWLFYSDRLVDLPTGIVGVAIGTVILPALSREKAANDPQHFSRMIDWGLRTILLLSLPAAIAIFILAEPMLVTLFHYGKMTDHDIVMTAMSLRALCFGMIGYMLIKVLAPGFYARQDTKTPVRIGIVAVVANMVFNLLLVGPLAHVGLALSTALASFVNAGLLGRGLWRAGVLRFHKGWWRYGLQIGSACLLMAAALLWWVPPWQQWVAWGAAQRAEGMALTVVGAMVIYFGWLAVTGMRVSQFRMRG
ncbi:putative lipid II flippase MurJ [Carnimonas sp. R-84981]|uniref:murein biosynthesis integral membrane protein MurJ n=1 Tax=Carnimonas bestiolae TaxID=3402172 RepID=UPI003EDBB76F